MSGLRLLCTKCGHDPKEYDFIGYDRFVGMLEWGRVSHRTSSGRFGHLYVHTLAGLWVFYDDGSLCDIETDPIPRMRLDPE